MLLISQEGNRRVVVQACDQALRAGVQPGMSVAHAQALLPDDAVVKPYEPERVRAALEALSRWAYRFTPIVQADPPDGLLLEISGCEHLYGGTRPMLHHVIQQTQQLGVAVRGAIGPTVGCAWALARFGRSGTIIDSCDAIAEALSPLPVQALRLEDDEVEALHSVAVETVDQLTALPRRSLAERFGGSLLLRLDQATGQAFESVQPLVPGEPIRVAREFAGPVKQLEAVLQVGHELVSRLCDQLEQQEAGARQIRVELERIDAANLHESLTLSRPSHDGKHLWRLLRPKLEQVHMGFGIERIVLHAVSVARLPHQQDVVEGWGDAAASQPLDRALGALVDQFTARLGPDRVSVIETKQTHVPEQAFVHRPLDAQQTGRGSAEQVMEVDRPTLLHDRPQPVRVVLLSPDGPVMTMGREGRSVRIIRSVGPERITPRWWLVGGDHRKARPRDYYKVQDEHGRWWWLYRQAGTSRWFVHGRWA